MRIISGKFRGTKLFLPQNKKTRPLKDQAKESIFNLLEHSKKISFKIKDSNVLDLYAGTGSFGLECLSRQSKKVNFVEQSKDAVKILKKNIEKLNLEKKTNILIDDILSLNKKNNVLISKFDLIFCDPPFDNKNIFNLIELIKNIKLLNKSGIIILHRHKNSKDEFPNYFINIDQRIYGISKVIFAKLSI